jgi:organic radical activating enzyme
MLISGMEKLTLSDYPDKLAAIIFTQGCNFKCPFCQNAALIPLKNNHYLTEDEVLNYLEKRKKILDGLVISGGEPTLQKDLKAFIKKVKAIPLKVIKEQHDLKKIENIINLIGPDNLYYLQNFKLSQDVPNQKLHGFSQEELQEINNKLNKKYPNVKVRGL